MSTIMEDSNAGDMANHEYPRDKTRPMHILHLPMDILLSIFDHVHNDRNIKLHIRRDDHDIKTIQSARLVCTLFNRLGSPFLCPILTVQLDQASLDCADKISRAPLIAAGVRSIDVVLHYCPKELAEDLSRYKNQRENDLNSLSSSCDYQAETWYLGGHDPDDETVCEQPLRVYNKAMADYSAIISAWDEYIGQPDVASTDEDTLKYQEILRQGHEEYKQKHKEQFRLIMDGSFVETLALAISRMRHGTSLHFVDEIGGWDYLNRCSDDPTRMSTHPDELPRLMAIPLDWRTIENLEGGAELLPAKILSELPIAIHKAGATVLDILIRCFPTVKNYSMIRPSHDPNNPSWPDLRSASQHLTEFFLSTNQPPIRDRHLRPEEHCPIDQYLCAILSGHDIEDVRLYFHGSNVNDGGLYRIGTILATANWPRLKRFSISDVSLDPGKLENFFRKLDGSRMERVYLRNVELLDGNWAGALDLLRERVASRCLDGKCEVEISKLKGGGFGKGILTKNNSSLWFSGEESDEEEDEGEKLIAQAQSYVSGARLQHPLRVE
ncbi:hypothetical protein VE01_07590 [Pseudogymnoascus verrucosus]|uniref:F-box domain-containing protein n=1 Tax=Pseudogymnoascus verrucosus TaxID=342668 RepID=A0A1B8GHF6_9PEZI|nr:uncharacterized protein VE01_07590 [Pseudogymnoascus verrucosus]OBT95245.1 hypothetical protein VE01_07590 [Pseudogymnoascus verrucosus]